MNLVQTLLHSYPQFAFRQDSHFFRWSPKEQTIYYASQETSEDAWSLLHELGHALLQHSSYEQDMELLEKEVAAWQKALILGEEFAVTIDPDHIQNCLDTYRDWLHKRSQCPQCTSQGLQKPSGEYFCINCGHTWLVSKERLCRPYRRQSNKKEIQ